VLKLSSSVRIMFSGVAIGEEGEEGANELGNSNKYYYRKERQCQVQALLSHSPTEISSYYRPVVRTNVLRYGVGKMDVSQSPSQITHVVSCPKRLTINLAGTKLSVPEELRIIKIWSKPSFGATQNLPFT
jgi:hypothetical protein